jgi:rod shape-determining protein MreC
MSDKADSLKKLSEVMAENEELQKQVDSLTSELNTIILEQYELDNLRELYDLDQKYPGYEKVAANVIGMNGVNWFSQFTIDKGTDSGIETGMNVIAGSGLVGIVSGVGKNYATVTAIISDTSKVSGMVTTTSDNLIVSGSLQQMNENMVIDFSNLGDKDDEVSVGDPVVTSYISDQYQQGILIGYISTISTDSNNLTKSGTLTPAVDFEHIEEVLVILNKKQTAEDE